jgi:hypothetical protein
MQRDAEVTKKRYLELIEQHKQTSHIVKQRCISSLAKETLYQR